MPLRTPAALSRTISPSTLASSSLVEPIRRRGLRCSGPARMTSKFVTMPSIRGSKRTVAKLASAVVSRRRAAAKNCVRTASSGELEQQTAEETISGMAVAISRIRSLILLLDELRNRHDLVVALDVDQFHSLSRPADRPDVV